MNWVIRKLNKLKYHTNLIELFKPICEEINNHNWIISDFEFNGCDNFHELPINYEEEYFILKPEQFKRVIDSGMQMIWGVILAVPLDVKIEISNELVPFIESNPFIFEDGHIQYQEAVMEIDCFDSSYTIVKFKDEVLSNKFTGYFDEAVALDKFRSKHTKNE
ncbi:hypothetical protein [Mucilaginibacter gotjawali]|uniref:Uncharacterized protein n=1 Tax=Mucilaginibacter gotjawali TaxID=1550579 RepID=A0A839SAH4_9SPHI|nr:hypothetical protein [Mucilaginibacter gotjawali]MBB3055045.1 hypothetical protein [Mucilaginibacter gotjawali]